MGSQQEESELAVNWTQRNCRKILQVQEAVGFSFAEETK
ncbi:unnamed protein product [Arabidopsis halleri]